MLDYALTESQLAQYPNDFRLVDRVDRTTGAIIGAVWREILNNSEDIELVFKVQGFVYRGRDVYALINENQLNDNFHFYDWLNQRLDFQPDKPLNPLFYIQIFGEGHLPEKLSYILSDIEQRRNIEENSANDSFNQYSDSESITTNSNYDFYDETEEATTILADNYYMLRNRDYKFNLYEEQGEKIIGRGKNSDLRFNEKYVSRNHARIRLDHDGLKIYDLGSSNGTKINGRKIRSHEWTYVRVGDILTIGRANLDVILVEDEL